jgi:hypothetical protein
MELTRVIARLLSEPQLGAAFRAAPRPVAEELCTGSAASLLAAPDPAKFERQAADRRCRPSSG